MDKKDEWKGFLKFAAVIVVPMLFLVVRYHVRRSAVRKDFVIAQGRIIDYSNAQKYSVEGRGRIIRYAYEVSGVTYERKVQTDRKFPDCEVSWDQCQRKRYWVIYAKTDPENSLINLGIEIQNSDNAIFPQTVDDFY